MNWLPSVLTAVLAFALFTGPAHSEEAPDSEPVPKTQGANVPQPPGSTNGQGTSLVVVETEITPADPLDPFFDLKNLRIELKGVSIVGNVANIGFRFEIQGKIKVGTTDGGGKLTVEIPDIKRVDSPLMLTRLADPARAEFTYQPIHISADVTRIKLQVNNP